MLMIQWWLERSIDKRWEYVKSLYKEKKKKEVSKPQTNRIHCMTFYWEVVVKLWPTSSKYQVVRNERHSASISGEDDNRKPFTKSFSILKWIILDHWCEKRYLRTSIDILSARKQGILRRNSDSSWGDFLIQN
jgi:hypothetical protein